MRKCQVGFGLAGWPVARQADDVAVHAATSCKELCKCTLGTSFAACCHALRARSIMLHVHTYHTSGPVVLQTPRQALLWRKRRRSRLSR